MELADDEDDFISLIEMHDEYQGRGGGDTDTVKTIWGLWVFSDPAAQEGETRMAEIMARVMRECAEKMEMSGAAAAWAGNRDDDVSSSEEGKQGRKGKCANHAVKVRRHSS